MTPDYTLHFAPDNASLVIRIALESLGLPYDTALVDRSARAQHSAAYKALNPLGMIPALQTPQGVIFETGAILLWLCDRHAKLLPLPDSEDRGDALKWLFFLSNSLHAGLRQMFYPEKFIDAQHSGALRDGIAQRIRSDFAQIDRLILSNSAVIGAANLSALDIYACTLFRWAQLYPLDMPKGWVRPQNYPNLLKLAARLETEHAVKAAQTAEGLGPTPFTNPTHANPPVGTAT